MVVNFDVSLVNLDPTVGSDSEDSTVCGDLR